jgi:hypothetical protein
MTETNGAKTYITVSATIIGSLFAGIMIMLASINSKLETIRTEQSKIDSRISVCESRLDDHGRRIDRVETAKLITP